MCMWKYFWGSWIRSQFPYITVGVDFDLPWRYINLYWWWLETRQAPTIWSSLRIYLFHWKRRHKELLGISSEVTVIYDKFCFYLCLFINGKWTTGRSLLSDSLESVCIMVTPPIPKSTSPVRILILLTQIDLVYRVYMLFQFNHEGPIA